MSPSFRDHRFLLALSAAISLALATSAEANVRTTIPGSACEEGGIFPGANNTQHIRHGNGHSFEYIADVDDGVGIPVECPLNRNLPLSTAGLSDLEVVVEGHPTATRQVICSAFSMRPDGTVVDVAFRSVNIPPAAFVTLDFGKDINMSVPKGIYHLSCQLPPHVEIHSVYHSEEEN